MTDTAGAARGSFLGQPGGELADGGEISRWRAAYTPGRWLVLSGPTSLVVLEPSALDRAPLVNTLWGEVMRSASLVELAERLAGYRIGELGSFAALFWSESGMTSLVRGEISIIDLANGRRIADGAGVQTWRETGLASIDQVRIELEPAEDQTLVELPLVVGVVTASSVSLEIGVEARVVSPQANGSGAGRLSSAVAAEARVEPARYGLGGGLGGGLGDGPGHVGTHDVDDAYGTRSTHRAPSTDFDLDRDLFRPEQSDFEQGDTEVMAASQVSSSAAADDYRYDEYPEWTPSAADPRAAEPTVEPADPDGEPYDGQRPDWSEPTQRSDWSSSAAEQGWSTPVDERDWSAAGSESDYVNSEAAKRYGQEPQPRRVAAEPEPERVVSRFEPSPGEAPILAVLCPRRHSNSPGSTTCRVCGDQIQPQHARLVSRPVLAVLRSDDGSQVELDGPVVVGRAPDPGRATSANPRLMTVVSPGHDISRSHVQIEPYDWDIVVTDLRSTNGTAVVFDGPRGPRQRLSPGESMVVTTGTILELGDGVSVSIDLAR